MVAIPMWGVIADCYRKSRLIFILSLVAWLVAYYSISLVSPVFHVGYCQDNSSVTLAEDILNDLIKESDTTKSSHAHALRRIQLPTKIKLVNSSVPTKWGNGKRLGKSRIAVQTIVKRQVLHRYTLIKKSIKDLLLESQIKANKITDNSYLYSKRKNIKRSVSMDIKRNIDKTASDNYLRELRHKLRKYDKTKSELVSKILSIAESRANSSAVLNTSEISSIFNREQLERIFDYLNMQGHYPWPLDTIIDYKKTQDSAEWENTQNSYMFTVLFVITAVGTLLSSPSDTLADIATLQQLGM
jgi:hypothetical protein